MKEIQQEITPITNEDLFIILNHPNAHFDYPIHCHPEYEINLVMNTRGSRIVGDSTEDFGPLDLVMTGPYVPHVWKSPLKTNHVITIQFSGDLIDFPIFNVADIYVTFVCAAGLCLAFFGHFEEKDFDFLKRRKPDSKKEA